MLPNSDLLRLALSSLIKWRLTTHGRVSDINQVLLVESAVASLEAVLSEHLSMKE